MPDEATTNADDGTLWLHVEEAAARLGLRPAALRTRIARGQHPHRKDNRGRLLVPVSAALAPPSFDEDGHRQDEEVERLRQRVEELTVSLHEAQLALAKAEAAGEIARAKAEAEVAAQRELVVELRAMLADARRPFWRRWVGA
jgi:hypothetical protein